MHEPIWNVSNYGCGILVRRHPTLEHVDQYKLPNGVIVELDTKYTAYNQQEEWLIREFASHGVEIDV